MTNKKMLTCLVVILCMALTVVVAGCGGAKSTDSSKPKNWKLGHVRPVGSIDDIAMKEFADKVKSETAGTVNIQLFPSSQLGDYKVVQERIGMGDIEMQLAPVSTSVNKGLGIAAAPYLATNWAEARKIYARDGVLIKAVSQMFQKQGIRLLAVYPKYFGGIALSTEPKSPGDPNVAKGIKIRVPGMKSFELTGQALGYISTPLAFSEAFTAMQTGIVNGVLGSGAEGYYSSFRDLTKFYLPVNSHFEMWFLYVSESAWKKLSDKEQKVLEAAAVKLESDTFVKAEKLQKEFEDKLAAGGTKVYKFTDAELAAFAKKVRAEVWPKIKQEYGAELFDSLTKGMN